MNATRPGTADHADDRMHRSFGSFFHHRHFSRDNARSATSGHGHGHTACGKHAATAAFDAAQIGRGTMPAKTVRDRHFAAVARVDRCTNVAPLRVLRPLGHDHDFPGVLMGHHGNRQARGPLADVFHFRPDRGLELFARFCRFLQLVSFTARNETTGSGYPRERFEKRREPWPSATGAILKRRAIVPESRAPPG